MTAIVLAALAWGALAGFITAAMAGIWWQLPYFGIACLAFLVAALIAVFRESQ